MFSTFADLVFSCGLQTYKGTFNELAIFCLSLHSYVVQAEPHSEHGIAVADRTIELFQHCIERNIAKIAHVKNAKLCDLGMLSAVWHTVIIPKYIFRATL